MGYVEDNLIRGETIGFRARVHWGILLPGILLLPVVIGLVPLISASIARATTELAVTNKRVIFKTGWLNRTTFEMHLDKIENIHIEQSVFARGLDFGTIMIAGTGGDQAGDWICRIADGVSSGRFRTRRRGRAFVVSGLSMQYLAMAMT